MHYFFWFEKNLILTPKILPSFYGLRKKNCTLQPAFHCQDFCISEEIFKKREIRGLTLLFFLVVRGQLVQVIVFLEVSG